MVDWRIVSRQHLVGKPLAGLLLILRLVIVLAIFACAFPADISEILQQRS